MTTEVGVIGLGAMGQGMALNLARRGFAVRGWDVRREANEAFVKAGGKLAASAAEAAKGADLLLLVVFTTDQAEDVLFGAPGGAAAVKPGATVIVSTTYPPDKAEALEKRLAAVGLRMLDAPVTGGKKGADEATMTVIASGSDAAWAAAEPACKAMAKTIYRVGDRAGQASLVKMINQLLVGIHGVAAAEALTLATKAGADPNVVYDVITHGVGNSFVFERQAPLIFARDFDPRGVVGILVKDLAAVLDVAKAHRFPLPLGAAAHQQFMAAAGHGHEGEDACAVVKVYEALSGVDVAAAAQKGRKA
jgi:3-hydroxyisobutyrate dehydrogenase